MRQVASGAVGQEAGRQGGRVAKGQGGKGAGGMRQDYRLASPEYSSEEEGRVGGCHES